MLSIFLVTVLEATIPVTFEMSSPEIWLFKKEIKSFDFRIKVKLTDIY